VDIINKYELTPVSQDITITGSS